jgi:hypothetical protein
LDQGIFVFSVIRYEKLVYAGIYEYPLWGELLGWSMAMASILWIPGYAVYYLLRQEGTITERWSKGITSVVPPRKDIDTTCIDNSSDSSAMDVFPPSMFPMKCEDGKGFA